MGDLEELKQRFEKAGFSVVVGAEAVLDKILELAPEGKPITWKCSGFGVFPDGSRCNGCTDCETVRKMD